VTADLAHPRFLVFHPAFGYFASAYGLRQVAIEEEGKAPGPARLAAVIEAAKADGIKVVFVEPQFSSSAARTIASAIGGEVVVIDPLAADWPAGMQAIARAFGEALAR